MSSPSFRAVGCECSLICEGPGSRACFLLSALSPRRGTRESTCPLHSPRASGFSTWLLASTCSSPPGVCRGLPQVFHHLLPGAPKGQVPEWRAARVPGPALGVDVRTPGRECSGLWGECQVGGGGNSNQIRHTTCRPRCVPVVGKAGVRGNRKDLKRGNFR